MTARPPERRGTCWQRLAVAAASVSLSATLATSVLGPAVSGCGPRAARVPRPEGAAAAHPESAPSESSSAVSTPKPAAPITGVRHFHVTLYFIASQPCPDPAQVPLERCGGGSLATVSHAFHKTIAMQGSGKLCDGRVVGVQKVNPLCFVAVSADHPWGTTASGRPATPFRSIAVDPSVLPLGRWYYLPDLDGLPLPEPLHGKRHDGCVRADDVGSGVKGEAIDVFVGPKAAMASLASLIATGTVRIADPAGHCEGAVAFPDAPPP